MGVGEYVGVSGGGIGERNAKGSKRKSCPRRGAAEEPSEEDTDKRPQRPSLPAPPARKKPGSPPHQPRRASAKTERPSYDKTSQPTNEDREPAGCISTNLGGGGGGEAAARAEVMAAAAVATATAVARPVLFLEDGDDEAEAHTDNAPGDDTADGQASVNDEAVEQQHQH